MNKSLTKIAALGILAKAAAKDEGGDRLYEPASASEQILGSLSPYTHARRMGVLNAVARAKGYDIDSELAEYPTLSTLGSGLGGAVGGGLLGYSLAQLVGKPEYKKLGAGLGALVGGWGTSALTNYLIRRDAEKQLAKHMNDPVSSMLAHKAAKEFADEDRTSHTVGGGLFPTKGSFDSGYGDALARYVAYGDKHEDDNLDVVKSLAGALPVVGMPTAIGIGASQSYGAREKVKDKINKWYKDYGII